MYSVFISKPLVKMDKIARQMAEFDFTQKLDIDNNDEIGSLANSLNMLSDNLEDSIEKLELSNERLRDFTANASHELKTPLAIISGYVEGMHDGIYGEDVQVEYFNYILIEVEKMNKIGVKRKI